MEDVETGLHDLARLVDELGITSIAVPPLGCGDGGLDWQQVRPLIITAFERLPQVEVQLFPPEGAPAAAETATRTARPTMTVAKAASSPPRIGTPTTCARRCVRLEGHFITGFGDGSTPVQSAEPIKLLPDAVAEAESVLAAAPETPDRIERVIRLSEGFESAYGMELLASVHWVSTTEVPDADVTVAAELVGRWNARKRRMMCPEHVRMAWARLRSERWLPAGEAITTG